jgi:MFS family permease
MSLLQKFLIPAELDPRVQASFRREQWTELTLPLATGLMEGGFVAVVAAKAFSVPPWMIAVISASPMFGNLSSFLWNRLAAGRPKVPMLTALQCMVLLCVAAVALSPRSEAGAWVLLVSVVVCRLLIAGILTLRSIAWSLNYDHRVRARVTARLQATSSLMVVLSTGLGSLLLDSHPESFRWLYGLGVLAALLGIWAFSGVRLQGELRHQVLERRSGREEAGRSGFVAILRADPYYARYQGYQFISGLANMMMEPVLVYLVSRQIGASYATSIAIVMIIPFLLTFSTLHWWAPYFDRVHVSEFRARQNSLWVIGTLVMFWGAMTMSLAWLAVGRVMTSVVNAGGNLAWQLGHNDFAPREQLSAYMGIHVTLTGVRGAIAPLLGMGLYLGWNDAGHVPGSTGLGVYTFLVAVVLGLIAWRGFDRLHRDIQAQASGSPMSGRDSGSAQR